MVKKLLLLFCFLVLSLPQVGLAADTTIAAQQEQTVTISASQLNNLKLIANELQMRLQLLKSNSQADKQRLEELSQQLMIYENQINQAQTSLTNAQDSLTSLNDNLKKLESQINELEHKLDVKDRQNKTGWAVAGVAVLVSMLK